ncbi:MAG: alginate export family protein [Muribaculaceae bacterium]|nr:alginate export family protein [Muribaculaceae bacterium]
MVKHKYLVLLWKAVVIAAVVLTPANALAQEQNAQPQSDSGEKVNTFAIDAELMTRSELRMGGLPDNEEDHDNKAYFILERTRLGLDYERSFIKAHVTGQHSAIWGQAGKGSFNLYEAWVQLTSRKGFFTKIGRQVLSYDDERIIGSNDWAMAALSHDLIKLGYDSDQHKVHLMLAYNQNSESVNGGTEYRGGDKPYKTMQNLWYHYSHPRVPFGASLLFMNQGLQSENEGNPKKTYYQQLLGTYLSYTPRNWSAEGSFYYQMGKNETGVDISAWMASVKGSYSPSWQWKLTAGYDILSGDPYFAVPSGGGLGLVQHKTIKGFSPVYGSHHKFYGAMDFFYISTYYNGFTPGLQNLYAGVTYKPISKIKLDAAYHYFAIATNTENLDKPLGHELELSASYTPIKEVTVSIGYSYMHGTETMERLKRVDNKRDLHWAWLNLIVRPRFLQVKW